MAPILIACDPKASYLTSLVYVYMVNWISQFSGYFRDSDLNMNLHVCVCCLFTLDCMWCSILSWCSKKVFLGPFTCVFGHIKKWHPPYQTDYVFLIKLIIETIHGLSKIFWNSEFRLLSVENVCYFFVILKSISRTHLNGILLFGIHKNTQLFSSFLVIITPILISIVRMSLHLCKSIHSGQSSSVYITSVLYHAPNCHDLSLIYIWRKTYCLWIFTVFSSWSSLKHKNSQMFNRLHKLMVFVSKLQCFFLNNTYFTIIIQNKWH